MSIITGLLIGYLWIAFKFGSKYRKSIFGTRRIKGRSGEIPLKNDIPAMFYILAWQDRVKDKTVDYQVNLIAAYILKWIGEGSVAVRVAADGNVDLSFEKEIPSIEEPESLFYDVLVDASGENRILEGCEISDHSLKEWEKVSILPTKTKYAGREWLSRRHILKSHGVCTEKGYKETVKLVMLENYFSDIISGKGPDSVLSSAMIDYMRFAALWGRAADLYEAFRKNYPDAFSEMCRTLGIPEENLNGVIAKVLWLSEEAFTYARMGENTY